MKQQNKNELLQLLKVIHYDIECLEILQTDDNKYHYKLATGNLKDLIKIIQQTTKDEV